MIYGMDGSASERAAIHTKEAACESLVYDNFPIATSIRLLDTAFYAQHIRLLASNYSVLGWGDLSWALILYILKAICPSHSVQQKYKTKLFNCVAYEMRIRSGLLFRTMRVLIT